MLPLDNSERKIATICQNKTNSTEKRRKQQRYK